MLVLTVSPAAFAEVQYYGGEEAFSGSRDATVFQAGANPANAADIKGLLADKNDESTLIPEVNVSDVPSLKMQGIISGGMIPKIDCCVEAVRRGVAKTCIIDGRVAHSILIEILSNEGIGTLFH